MYNNEFIASHNMAENMEVDNGICRELETLFNSVMATVVDYFEEAAQ